MVKQLNRRGAILVMAITAVLTAVLGLGFITPALAEDDTEPTYVPDAAKLTKVIVAPVNTDATGERYVFHFAGGGTVTESGDKLYSDGVEQDATTLKKDDVVPTIPDVTLNGIQLTANNSLTNGQASQGVVQMSITDILNNNNVKFPHAGVYTYVVSEKSATTDSSPNSDKLPEGTYVNASKAQYTLRIRVSNTKTEGNSVLGNTELTVESVTVEQTKNDNGDDASGKVDPTYPTTDDNGKITNTGEGQLAGNDRGRDVPGFTFANEYVHGGQFMVKKLYDGKHSDRTKYSFVELTIYSAAAAEANAHGAVVTYLIEGEGIDRTENGDADGEHRKLTGMYDIPQVNHYMATFDDKGWCYIKAELKEGSSIRITGEFGPYNPLYESEAVNKKDRRMTLSLTGLLDGQKYYVIERIPGDYVPTGYVYVGDDSNTADPRVNPTATGMTTEADWTLTSEIPDPTDHLGDDQPYHIQDSLPKGALCVEGTASGSATTVFAVNKIDESNVSPTGIFIDNLPYILMVGIPVAVFGVMFVNRLRNNVAA